MMTGEKGIGKGGERGGEESGYRLMTQGRGWLWGQERRGKKEEVEETNRTGQSSSKVWNREKYKQLPLMARPFHSVRVEKGRKSIAKTRG